MSIFQICVLFEALSIYFRIIFWLHDTSNSIFPGRSDLPMPLLNLTEFGAAFSQLISVLYLPVKLFSLCARRLRHCELGWVGMHLRHRFSWPILQVSELFVVFVNLIGNAASFECRFSMRQHRIYAVFRGLVLFEITLHLPCVMFDLLFGPAERQEAQAWFDTSFF